MHKPSQVLVLADRKSLLALTVLRVVVGLIMAAHGFQKLSDPSQFSHHLAVMGFPAPNVMAYCAIAGELLGGLGLAVGLLTRLAALGVATVLVVGIGAVHWSKGLFAATGGFEYPLVLVCVALWFMAAGPGPWSLDAWWRAARDRSPGQGQRLEPAVSRIRPSPSEPMDVITEAGNESFPASDAPAHSRHEH
ncbi:MAG TPA: DoxX family protein [Polyangiales bacterium]|nr:DoxX family protein [Polyangiales bacterium]